jgi:hypothetical protein
MPAADEPVAPAPPFGAAVSSEQPRPAGVSGADAPAPDTASGSGPVAADTEVPPGAAAARADDEAALSQARQQTGIVGVGTPAPGNPQVDQLRTGPAQAKWWTKTNRTPVSRTTLPSGTQSEDLEADTVSTSAGSHGTGRVTQPREAGHSGEAATWGQGTRDDRGTGPEARRVPEMPQSGQQGTMPTRQHASAHPVPDGRDPRTTPPWDEVDTPEVTASPDARRLPDPADPQTAAPDEEPDADRRPEPRLLHRIPGGGKPGHTTTGYIADDDERVDDLIEAAADAPGERPRPAYDRVEGTATEVRYQSALNPVRPAPPGRPAAAIRGAPAALDPTAAAQRPQAVQPLQAVRHPPAAQMAAQRDRLTTGDQPGDQGTEKVPAGLASAFRTLHGADVSDVPVRRGRAVARQAARLDAAAFSRDGVVYMPDAAGSLNQVAAGALLAHELTHVVQQRILGSELPGEASPEGRALEEQALATQLQFLGGTGAVPALALLHGTAAAQPARAPVMRHLHLAPAASASEFAATPSASSPVSPAAEPGVQRQPVDIAGVVGAVGGSPAFGRPTWREAYPAADLVSVTEETGVPGVIGDAIAGLHDEIAELRTHAAELAELADGRHLDLDDPVELDELATSLYGRLRSKLRLELIVDRERAGLLTDFR